MLTSCSLENCRATKDTKCNGNGSYLSAIDDIIHEQQLLFGGYMRMEILNNLSEDASKIISDDVLFECNKFYILPILPLMEASRQEYLINYNDDNASEWLNDEERKDEADMYCINDICHDLSTNNEYWQEYKLIHVLLKYDTDDDLLNNTNRYYGMLCRLLARWYKGNEQGMIKAFEELLRLEPGNWEILKEFGDAFRRQSKNKKAIDKYLIAMEYCDDIENKMQCFAEIGACFRSNRYAIEDTEQQEKVAKVMAELGSDDLDIYVRDSYVQVLHDMEKYELALNKSLQLLSSTSEELKYWLSNIVELPDYYDLFIQNGYETLELVKEIEDKQKLRDIGIVYKGHQYVILAEIWKLKETPLNDEMTIRHHGYIPYQPALDFVDQVGIKINH